MSSDNPRPPSLTNYIVAELEGAGVSVELIRKSRSGYVDPWKNVLMVYAPKPFTIWVVLHRRNELAGKVQVEHFSEPFSPAELPEMGPAIVSKIRQIRTRRPWRQGLGSCRVFWADLLWAARERAFAACRSCRRWPSCVKSRSRLRQPNLIV